MRTLKIFTDGGARGNPGPAASAFVIFENDKEIHKDSKFLGISTNNFAEYQGVILAIDHLIKDLGTETKNTNLEFYLDSLLVVSQLNGNYKIKNETLITLAISLKDSLKLFNKVSFNHVPRSQNALADGLVNKCLDENRP